MHVSRVTKFEICIFIEGERVVSMRADLYMPRVTCSGHTRVTLTLSDDNFSKSENSTLRRNGIFGGNARIYEKRDKNISENLGNWWKITYRQ